MNEKNNKQFPHNRPYIESKNIDQASPRSSKSIKNIETVKDSPSVMSASALAERVQFL